MQHRTQIAGESGEQMGDGGGDALDVRNFGLIPTGRSDGGAVAGNGFARVQMGQSEPDEPKATYLGENYKPNPPQSGVSTAPRSSLEFSDNQAAAVAVAPRVTLADIEAAIAERYDVPATRFTDLTFHAAHPLHLLSICILVMRNGFTVIGKSAPASPENFDAELGRKSAYEDAVRQLWPLMGYALRNRLAGAV